MQDLLTLNWFALMATPAIAAIAATIWLAPRGSGGGLPGIAARFRRGEPQNPVWLFDGPELIDATTSAKRLSTPAGQTLDWSGLYRELSARFPGFPSSHDDIGRGDSITVSPADAREPCSILCEHVDGIIRVELRRTRARPGGQQPDPAPEMPPAAMIDAPYPVWRIEASGRISWYNPAYDALYRKARRSAPDPDMPLFTLPGSGDSAARKTRCSTDVDGDERKLWYDVWTVESGTGQMCYAVDINAVVDAEIAQRNFVQTLAKTFAQLSIGLAIFDRNRQLALFNPALIDLTSLPVDFLSARPNLFSFFDRLRDLRMMPEPKNYGSWRDQMAELAVAAADGRYQETWSLPSGSVYTVSGRPHPDGAVAFLFEDITAEITLTRRFRSDLEMGQSILDRLDQAISVFSMDGKLILSNAAFQRLWKLDPHQSFAQISILDATRVWHDRCAATPLWGDLRDFVVSGENRTDWWSEIHLLSGEALTCSICPVAGGATLISFDRVSERAQPPTTTPATERI